MAAWVVPAIEAAGSIAGSVASGLFGYNQAAKNRSFQERMYYQQLEDNRENWQRVADYSLPSAELQRIKDAGLNPLLYYQNGAGSMAGSQIATANAPHGAQANGNFGNPLSGFTQSMAQMRMLNAQIDNIIADTEQKRANAEDTQAHKSWQELETEWNRKSFNIRLMLQHGQYDKVAAEIRSLDGHLLNDTHFTFEQTRTLAQARLYEIKRFDLDAETIGTQLQQRWKEIANGTIAANAQMKSACAQMLQAQVALNLSKWQTGLMAQEILYNFKANPLKIKNLKWQNVLNRQDFTNKQIEGLNNLTKTLYLYNTGSEQFNSMISPLFLLTGKISGRIK